jgi:hypothetical protein
MLINIRDIKTYINMFLIMDTPQEERSYLKEPIKAP